jgi:hypothetical protein
MNRHRSAARRSLFVITIGLALSMGLVPLASGATFNVDRTDDNATATACSDAVPNDCSLRGAILASNSMPGADVINLPGGVYTLVLGSLEISNHLSITGSGAASTIIDGDNTSRVLGISNPGTNPIVNVSGVTIRNGEGGIDFGTGVSISQGASLFLANSVVSDNRSAVGGVGIANRGSLTLFRSTVRNNEITGGGGGVTGTGAGILNSMGSVADIIESTISNNQGIRGGGISNSGSLDITNSTISGNTASVGGGIRNFPAGVVNISFSTITNNEAGLVTGEPLQNRVGGGIANLGQVNIGNTILAGNRDRRTSSDPLFSPDCFSVEAFRFTSFRGNLVGIINENCDMRDTIFGAPPPFDMIGTEDDPLDPGLETDGSGKPLLGNNGGPTQTHALRSSSPAIDEGTGVTSATFFDCPERDQRGFVRPVEGDGECDIGAFEFGAVAPEISFQDGVSPTPAYAGTRDTYVSEDQPSANFCSLSNARADGDDPPGTGRNLYALLRWDVSALPAGTEVKSATITIHVTNPTGGTYELYRISSPWEECEVTWNTRPVRGVTVRGTVGPASDGTHTITLNDDGVALVQHWVDNPAKNRGIFIVDRDVTDKLAFRSREASPASSRPRLTITFE